MNKTNIFLVFMEALEDSRESREFLEGNIWKRRWMSVELSGRFGRLLVGRN
jgi:hypothetical protein